MQPKHQYAFTTEQEILWRPIAESSFSVQIMSKFNRSTTRSSKTRQERRSITVSSLRSSPPTFADPISTWSAAARPHLPAWFSGTRLPEKSLNSALMSSTSRKATSSLFPSMSLAVAVGPAAPRRPEFASTSTRAAPAGLTATSTWGGDRRPGRVRHGPLRRLQPHPVPRQGPGHGED